MREVSPEPLSDVAQEKKNEEELQFIEVVTANAGEVQVQVLREILSRSADAEYPRRHGLDGRTADRYDFKKAMPVVTYEDIKADIDRIAAGDRSPILCTQPISEFLTSSGTSGGERKLMPATEDDLARRSRLYGLLMPVMSRFLPGLHRGKGMYFLFAKSESATAGGLPARTVLTSYYRSRHFRARSDNSYTDYTSPTAAILCLDPFQSTYSQLLCGLSMRAHVLRVGAVFASGFLRTVRFLQQHWRSICGDIRAGVMSPKVTDPAVRAAVAGILLPDPNLAEAVEAECGEESWEGIVRRLWPNAKYVEVVVTGAMSQYVPALEHYGGGLPLISTMYASSECYFGVNLAPLCAPGEVAYTLIPTMAYFEFLPLSQVNGLASEEELVDLVDVTPGQQYELVITTYTGLYRYRVGDILRVAGFKNRAPQFNFVRRSNVALSIDADKTDEVELQRAVEIAAAAHLRPLGARLAEYTSYADASTIPGHYVLYWEIAGGGGSASGAIPGWAVEECCVAVEEALNSVYRQCRAAEGSVGPLEVRVVEGGTFDAMMDYALAHLGASMNQYKTPRCVKRGPLLDLLDSRVLSSHSSPKCPTWDRLLFVK